MKRMVSIENLPEPGMFHTKIVQLGSGIRFKNFVESSPSKISFFVWPKTETFTVTVIKPGKELIGAISSKSV